MDTVQNAHLRVSQASRRRLGSILALLSTLLLVPSARAADPVSEVAAAGSAVVAAATTPAPSAEPSATESAPPAPAPAPNPAAEATAAATGTVGATGRSLGSGPTAAVSQTVGETVDRGTAAVDAVTADSNVPAVAETAHQTTEAVRSLAPSPRQPEAGDTPGQPSVSHQEAAPAASEQGQGGPAPRRGQAGPAPRPRPESRTTFVPPHTRGAPHPDSAAPARNLTLPSLAGIEPARASDTTAPRPLAGSGTADRAPAGIPTAPPALGPTASSSPGTGFGPSLLLLALLPFFLLAVSRTAPRLLAAGGGYRPAPFICALERPG